jgi:hypothetical protein
MEQSAEEVPGANPQGKTVEEHMATLETGGFRALQKLRADGEIKAFGAGINADGEEAVTGPGRFPSAPLTLTPSRAIPCWCHSWPKSERCRLLHFSALAARPFGATSMRDFNLAYATRLMDNDTSDARAANSRGPGGPATPLAPRRGTLAYLDSDPLQIGTVS